MTNGEKQCYIIDNSDRILDQHCVMDLEDGSYVGSVYSHPDEFECVIYNKDDNMCGILYLEASDLEFE